MRSQHRTYEIMIIINRYYRGAVAAVVVYDITNRESFDHLQYWIEELRQQMSSHSPILIV